jgi:hypothetical protein
MPSHDVSRDALQNILSQPMQHQGHSPLNPHPNHFVVIDEIPFFLVLRGCKVLGLGRCQVTGSGSWIVQCSCSGGGRRSRWIGSPRE